MAFSGQISWQAKQCTQLMAFLRMILSLLWSKEKIHFPQMAIQLPHFLHIFSSINEGINYSSFRLSIGQNFPYLILQLLPWSIAFYDRHGYPLKLPLPAIHHHFA